MYIQPRLRLLLSVMLLALITLSATVVAFAQTPQPATPRGAIERAWNLARASGVYTFQTAIDQQVAKQTSLRDVGRPLNHDYLSLRGTLDQPADTMQLAVWRSLSAEPNNAIEVRVANGQTQGRTQGGTWQDIDFDSTAFAPGGDPLGFLSGIGDVQPGVADNRELEGATLNSTSYRFTIDGKAFATQFQKQIEPKLREQGKLPSWMNLDLVTQYKDMSGTGTLWVDADGLPMRMRLNLEMPQQKGVGAVKASVTTDFSHFDRRQLALASSSFIDNPAGWLGYRINQLQTAMMTYRGAAAGMLVLLGLGALLFLLMRVLGRRRFYSGFVIFVVASLISSPLFQAHEVAAFSDKLIAEQSKQATAAQQAHAQQDAAAQLAQPAIAPHEPPSIVQPNIASVPSAQTSSATSYADTDGDGLTDANETEWGTCATLPSSAATCTNVSNSTDTDGDGLTDGQEANKIGTNPASADSDGDGIKDAREVAGFTSNGKKWYLDPNENDTNKDGAIDAVECPALVAGTATICPDSDSDGTPDPWDDDNDNDGVTDGNDIASNNVSTTYASSTPLELNITSLQPNKPVFVDVQLRPTAADHLGYINSVLDWPSGDTQGQIQRHLDTTFANTASTSLRSSDANASNGDLRLVPMLEITMPYQAGHYADLPVKAAYKNTTRTASMRVSDWLDTDKLTPFGITVRDYDATSGKLVTYVPLSAVVDSDTGMNVAFTGRMLYWPSQSASGVVNWGSDQEYRVVWLVQLLTDECVNSTDNTDTCTRQDTLQVLHTYDETWKLTGLSVREDHGMQISTLYENPSQDSDQAHHDDLWNASWYLENTWLRGRDCDSFVNGRCASNGSRDVTVSTIKNKLDAWTNNANSIAATFKSYDHQGYLGQVMMTDTPALLNSTFTSVDQEPTLLFAREETYRSAGLSAATMNRYEISVPMDSTTAPVVTQASMNWQRYQHSAANGWTTYDAQEDLNRLEIELSNQSFFQASNSSDSDSVNEAKGKIISAQSYYASMVGGVSAVVENGGKPFWTEGTGYGSLTEQDYAPSTPVATFTGASYVSYEVAMELLKASQALSLKGNSKFWATLTTSFDNPQTTSQFLKYLKGSYAALGSNALMVSTIAVTAAGLTIYAIGYFTGDQTFLTIGTVMLNAVTVVASVVWAANIIYGTVKILQSGVALASELSKLSTANTAVGEIGLVLGLAVTWGIFAFSMAHADVNSIAFNMALSLAIATTLVQIVLFMIDLIPIIGPLIVLTLYTIDALLYLVCECKGVQTMFAEWIAKQLYDVDFAISNFSSADRLDYNVTYKFLNSKYGFTSDQAIKFSAVVTNTFKYGKDNSFSDAREASIIHRLGKNRNSMLAQVTGLSLYYMEDKWSNIGGRKIRNVETLTDTFWHSFSQIGTGLNRTVEGSLYLSEGYALPYRGCWSAFGYKIDCDVWSAVSGQTVSGLGQYYVFDILPSSLTDFYNLKWNSTALPFPTQVDQDGDGLTTATDPYPTQWDGDGDGISDYTELTNGTNARKADSDGDGLTDREEMRLETDPLVADSDGDGLTDKEEWAGWLTAYAVSGSVTKYAWVHSDPFNADADDDGYNDKKEQTYGMHPEIAFGAEDVINTVKFSNSSVSVPGAPTLLMRFEETGTPQIFADSSGNGYLATCQKAAGSCPTAGVAGRYGNGLSFDGDDMLTLNSESPFDLTNMTISLWVKIDAFTKPNETIIAKGDAWGIRRYGTENKLAFYNAGTSLTVLDSTYGIADGKWHHFSIARYSNNITLYYDGTVDKGRIANGTIATNDASLTIGGSAAYSDRSFSGSIDEVVVYNFGKSSSGDMTKVFQGKYTAGNIVAPGTAVNANVTMANSSTSFPAAVTYYGETDASFSGYSSVSPFARWKLDETSGATSFADTSGNSRAATCVGAACPAAGATGYRSSAVQLQDGNVLKLDAGLSGSNFGNAIAFGGWVYPTGGGTNAIQRIFTLQSSDSTDGSSLLDGIYYNRDSKQFFSTYTQSNGSGSANLNQWHHVMLVYDRLSSTQFLYVDGALVAKQVVATASAYDPGRKFLRLGDPITTNDVSANSVVGFLGYADDLAVYNNQVLTTADIALIMANQDIKRPVEPSSQVMTIPAASTKSLSSSFTIPSTTSSGSFGYTQVAEAALNIDTVTGLSSLPVVRTHFDEPNRLAYSAVGNGYQPLTCTNCPSYVSDFAGTAVEFDGVDDQLTVAAPHTSSAWTTAVWINPTATDSTKRAIFGNRPSSGSGFPILYLTADRKIALANYQLIAGSSGFGAMGWKEYLPSSATTLTANRWYQVTLAFDGSNTFTIYLNGQVYGTVSVISVSSGTTIYVGTVGTGYNTFKGRLDNFTFYDKALSVDEIRILSSVQDLSLHGLYTFDERPGSTKVTDQVGILGDLSCTTCPRFGMSGSVNRAALFSGSGLTSAAVPTYWRSWSSSYTVAGWMKAQQGKLFEAKGINQPMALWTDRVSRGYGGSGTATEHDYYNRSFAFEQPTANQWVYVSAVYDYNGTNSGIYFNGVKQTDANWTSGSIPTASDVLKVADQLTGYLDELRIYNRALTSSEVSSLYSSSRPVLQYEFEEDFNASSFADSSGYSYTGTAIGATSGNAGRVGNALTLDGASAVQASNATATDSMATNLTLMAWVKPTGVSGTQTVLATSSRSGTNGLRFVLSGNTLRFGNSLNTVASTGTVSAGAWSHVAAVVDQANRVTFYINGVYAGSGSLTSSLSADSDSIVTAGARTADGGGNYSDFFTGKIDELYAYNRALGATEIQSAYINQYYWYRDETSTRLNVDADAPTINVINISNITAGPIKIAVGTGDTTSSVWAFDYTMTNPSGKVYKNQTVQPCADSINGSLWCITLDTGANSDGTYTFTFRAVDAAGNETTSAPYKVSVDTKAPTLTANYSSWVTPTPDSVEDLRWDLNLSGQVSDPTLNSVSSGIVTDTMTVALIDGRGTTVGGAPQQATVSGNNWSVIYPISEQPPVGYYSLVVQAKDAVGNTTSVTKTVRMDVRAPSVEFDSAALPDSFLSSTTLKGVVSELPNFSGQVANFHFTESAAATSFSGAVDGSITATCTSCPPQAASSFSYGRVFNAATGTALTVPATDTLDLSVGTLSAWVKPTWTAGANNYSPGILSVRDGSNTRFSWHIRDNYSAIELRNGDSVGSVPVSLTSGQWYHLALVQSGDQWTAYVNGVSVGTVNQSFGTLTGLPLTIGGSGAGENFSGVIDEVQLFNRALSSGEVYALAQKDVAGVSKVEVGFQPYTFGTATDGDTGTTWNSASATTNVSQSGWSYSIPSGLEDFYQLRLRGTDARSNTDDKGVFWRGAVDTKAPRITETTGAIPGWPTNTISATATFEDAFLDESTIEHPCVGRSNAVIQRSYWNVSDPPLLKRLTISCTIPDLPYYTYHPFTVKATDLAGNTSVKNARWNSEGANLVTIDTPTAGSTLAVGTQTTVSGHAYSSEGIRQLILKVDGVPVQTKNTDTPEIDWSFDWTPEVPGATTLAVELVTNWNQHYSWSVAVDVNGQLSPGGVYDGLGLWLSADRGVGSLQNGASVTVISEARNGWEATRTTGQDPTMIQKAINFNPALRFGNGSASELSFGSNFVTAQPGSTGMTVIVVAKPAGDTGSDQMLLDVGSNPNGGYGLAYSGDQIKAYAPAANTSGAAQVAQSAHASTDPALVAYTVTFGSGSSLAVNGATVGSVVNTALSQITAANIAHSASHGSTTGPLTIGRQAQNTNASGRYFRGQVAEVIIYNSTLTDAQRQKVESYLALKYGITLSTASVGGGNYVNTAGTVIWDANAEAAFHNRVAGIGRDDDSSLDQRKSRGTGSPLTIANGDSLTTPSAFTDDQSFLMWGDNGGSLTETTTVTSGTLTYQRLGRVWQVRESGIVGTGQLAFDTSIVSDTDHLPWLVISSDSTFNMPRFVRGTLVGNQAVYSTDLADGEYFTLAFNAMDKLKIAIAGNGAGTVGNGAIGIVCAATCESDLEYRSTVTLFANFQTGSTFTGWSGPCSGTDTCTVTVDQLDTITATFTLKRLVVGLFASGSGGGNITIEPAGTTCRGSCSNYFNYGTVVTLTLDPQFGTTFNGWSGACSGTALTCVLTMNDIKLVYISWTNPNGLPYGGTAPVIPGTVEAENFNEGGYGAAYSDSDGINRGNYRTNEWVDSIKGILGADNGAIAWTNRGEWLRYTVDIAEAGNYAVELRGANVGSGATLYLDVDGVRQTTKLAIPNTHDYTVYGSATTMNVSLPAGIHVLTITFPDRLKNVGSGDIDSLTFIHQKDLVVAKEATGIGTVTASTGDVNCGSDCLGSYLAGTTVTLTATANLGSTFAGWAGACSGMSDCTLTMNQAEDVTATFTLNQYPLMVALLGDPIGSVTSAEAGIDCGTDCAETLSYGTVVTLTANLAEGTFVGWGGVCSGTGDCVLTIDGSKKVTANFENAYAVTVTKDGTGSGLVQSVPESILCGEVCEALFPIGSTVTLTATADTGSTFAGWSGACSGTGDCVVTADQVRSVGATFTLNSYTLSTSWGGIGTGKVVGTGIDCGDDCDETLPYGTMVTISAVPDGGAVFGGWSGVCSGLNDCTFPLSNDTQVEATFYTCDSLLVTNGGDSGIGTLRQALSDICPGGRITFDGDQKVVLADRLEVSKGVTIDGEANNVTIDGDTMGLLYVEAGVFLVNATEPVTMTNLTIYGGSALRGGGNIYNSGTLTVQGSTITGGHAWGPGYSGGGIYNTGTLTVTNSVISDNLTSHFGGGIYSTPGSRLSVSGTTFTGNNGPSETNDGAGGGVYAQDADVTISSSTFSDSLIAYGGGVYVDGGTVAIDISTFSRNSATWNGGGLYVKNGTVNVTNSTFAGNSGVVSGAGIYMENGTVSVNGGSISSNTGTAYGAGVGRDGGDLTLTGVTLQGNITLLAGGAIRSCADGSLTLINSQVISNTTTEPQGGEGGGEGGGIVHCYGALTIRDTSILSNTATRGGGVVTWSSDVAIERSTIANNSANQGGGIIIGSGTTTIEGSTIANNHASGGIPGGWECADPDCNEFNVLTLPSPGGGLIVEEGAQLAAHNTTFAHNSAEIGGAIKINSGNITLNHSTVAGNTATASGGGINNQETLNLVNSIVADSVGGDCVNSGTANLDTSTLVEDGGCGAARSGSPLLAPLGNYGGTTQTMALLPGSPAINAGDSGSCSAFDQRGVARPVGTSCDLGAFESQGFQIAITGGDNQRTLPGVPFGQPLEVLLTANQANEPVGPGGIITFIAPSSGASLDTEHFTALTNASGAASAPVTANGESGSYAVSASGAGVDSPVNFTLTNDPDAPTPTMTRTATPISTPTSTATQTPTTTKTSTATSTATETNTSTATATSTEATNTEVSTGTATSTFTATSTETATGTNTPTSTATSTSTSIPNTSTATSTATTTATSTETATNTEVSTSTAISTFTATSTETATRTNTPTSTATETSTPNNTPTSSATETSTATATDVLMEVATSTSTATNTSTSTTTSSGTATVTSTPTTIQSSGDVATPTQTPTATPEPQRWIVYLPQMRR